MSLKFNSILFVMFTLLISYFNIGNIDNIVKNENHNNFTENYYNINMSKIPIPDSIVIYYDNKIKTYNKNSMVFYEIIKMNNERAICGELGASYTSVDIEWSKNNEILIEYKYNEKGPIYFNLLKDNQDEESFLWALVKYDEKICASSVYIGLKNSIELVNYINLLN